MIQNLQMESDAGSQTSSVVLSVNLENDEMLLLYKAKFESNILNAKHKRVLMV